jgi:hypothetical protein
MSKRRYIKFSVAAASPYLIEDAISKKVEQYAAPYDGIGGQVEVNLSVGPVVAAESDDLHAGSNVERVHTMWECEVVINVTWGEGPLQPG